jgi:hypothetical protein
MRVELETRLAQAALIRKIEELNGTIVPFAIEYVLTLKWRVA